MKQHRMLTRLFAALLALLLAGCGKAAAISTPVSADEAPAPATQEQILDLLLREVAYYEKGSYALPFDWETSAERNWGFAGVFSDELGLPYGPEGGRQELLRLMWKRWLGGASSDPDYYFSDGGAADVPCAYHAKESEIGETSARVVVSRFYDGVELLDAEYAFVREEAGDEVLSSLAAGLTLDGYLWRYDTVRTLPDDRVYEPVAISTEQELRDLCARVNAHEPAAVSGSFVLANDIALSPDELWEPMGRPISPYEDWDYRFAHAKTPGGFCGTFDGAGHTISGVVVRGESPNRMGWAETGFFGRLGRGARVFDLAVEGDVADSGWQETMNSRTGGFVGRVCGGAEVTNCRFTGTVDGYCYVGGFAGILLNDYDFEGCDIPSPIVKNCLADVSMTACYNSGGFAGEIRHGVSDCDAVGTLTIESKGGVLPIVIGGFAGGLSGDALTGCRSAVRVEYAVDGANRMGNFIGETSFLCEITDCVIDPACLHDGWYLIGMKWYNDSVVDIRKEAWQEEESSASRE